MISAPHNSPTLPPPTSPPPAAPPTFREALAVWFKIGCLSFGGPAGQIALMHRIVVDEKRWVDEPRFLHALNFCMLLPGPEAQQLATYLGWLLHGVRGGLIAGILFVVPGALVMLGLSVLYALGQGVPLIDGALFGIKAAVLVIVVEALLRIARRALKTRLLMAIAALAFVAIFFFALPFPLVIIAAAAAGIALVRTPPPAKDAVDAAPPVATSRRRQAATAVAVGLVAWWGPVALIALLLGTGHVLVELSLFFSKLAVVSFGGAYALLSYMAQQVVEARNWLQPHEVIDGLGLAETTPGPLILVTQFVGFLAAFRFPAPFSPLTGGLLGALITSWVTFTASMLWIFAGAPFVEALRQNARLAGALAAITAAVTGVILNLSLWFALHVLFGDVQEQRAGWLRWYAFDPLALDVKALALALLAGALAFLAHRSLVEIVLVMAALGAMVRLIGL